MPYYPPLPSPLPPPLSLRSTGCLVPRSFTMSSSDTAKVPIVEYCPPSSFATDMKVLKHMWFAKIVPGQSQQDRVRVLAGFESGFCKSPSPPLPKFWVLHNVSF